MKGKIELTSDKIDDAIILRKDTKNNCIKLYIVSYKGRDLFAICDAYFTVTKYDIDSQGLIITSTRQELGSGLVDAYKEEIIQLAISKIK